MTVVVRLLAFALCCLPAVAMAQAGKVPARDAKTAQPAPAAVSTAPDRTTASFGDWVLRCEVLAGQPKRVCEVAHAIVQNGQPRPIAEVAIGKQISGDNDMLTIVLPPNIAINVKPQIVESKAGAGPIELTWQRCMPGRCFASAAVSRAIVENFSAQTEPGRLLFKDAADRQIALPLSFRGLSQAWAALSKEP